MIHPFISPALPGARHVVAVEADAEMAELAQQVVDANGLGHVVVLQGRVEVTTKMGGVFWWRISSEKTTDCFDGKGSRIYFDWWT